MKKILKRLSILVIVIGLTGCPYPFDNHCGSSDEAKDLMQKILNIVGIPYDIIVNICQDDNKNGFCDTIELQSKLHITSTKEEIFWEKIIQESESRYILETRDYSKPILLELQDINRINFNDGRFTIHFDGFESKKQKEEKELSVLQAMVDKKYIKADEVEELKNLKTSYAQDKFYEYLFDGLEKNLNTLNEKGIDSNDAMATNIKTMAEKMIENNITTDLPIRIRECNDNECVDNELAILSEILIID